jgi:hypothetical protein
MQRPIIAINYYFGPDELGNRVFADTYSGGASYLLKYFKTHFKKHGYDVVTLDTVDPQDPLVRYIIYFDYNWRLLFSDPFLKRVPKEKRVLILIEPSNINPSMYYIPYLRNQFEIIFTWDLNLLKRNPSYTRINVLVGAEPRAYRENRFPGNTVQSKKLLVAVSGNRWSYMPQSTYGLRKKAFAYFGEKFQNDFDLYGIGWENPSIFYETWFKEWRVPKAFRGAIKGDFNKKIEVMAKYKFALCFENNASEPGYVSEKITDCFCARCIPIYYGSPGTEQLIPKETWINFRDFSDFDDLSNYLTSMTDERYAEFINNIEQFLNSPQADYFSTNHFCSVITKALLPADQDLQIDQ